MPGFSRTSPAAGVFHIRDPLGVFLTLVTGRDAALLLDAGYGIGNAYEYVTAFTSLPLTLVLSHGHHDHALGAMHFPRCMIRKEDIPVFERYTARGQREIIAANVPHAISDAGAFLSASIPAPEPLVQETFDLGGLTAQVILTPGHTPGSIAVFIPQRRLMLLGDNWNPQTWLFFPESPGLRAWMVSFERLLQLPFDIALASHRELPISRALLQAHFSALTARAIRDAQPIHIRGHEEKPACVIRTPVGEVIFRPGTEP